jgi:hypothetical protein
MVSNAARLTTQFSFPGSTFECDKTGLYLVPKDEPDIFDDENATAKPYDLEIPSWYEPEMITDDVLTFHDYQQYAIAEILNAFLIEDIKSVRLVLPTGCGKCLGRDTPVMMHDGTVKPVQDVKVGDLLMGPDSKSRRVISLARGEDNLYRVTPKKGEPYIVNEAHILSLKATNGAKHSAGINDGSVVNISVADYLQKSKSFRHVMKGYRVGVEFPERALAIEPYFMGLWLGDGHSWGQSITSVDPECIAYLQGYADGLGLNLTSTVWNNRAPNHNISGTMGKVNAVRSGLRNYGVLNNKHIPQVFKANSRENRLQLLAGLIDSDGSVNANGYDLVFKVEQLARDTAFVARSLGLAAYVTETRNQQAPITVFRFRDIPTKSLYASHVKKLMRAAK